jgi:hypothetical protein
MEETVSGACLRVAGIDTEHPRLGWVFLYVTTLYHVFDFFIFFFFHSVGKVDCCVTGRCE